ncbi:pectin lyase fold/virulence factor [Leptodontidium sp. 2 PMI_412]|nr:pectin lyase fold/virulence factor [Leptodontidium sp. 2 PMI_412]
MYSIISLASLVLFFSPSLAVAQVNGTAYGFATVILVGKNFNFIGLEGKATEAGCYQTRCTLAIGGQIYISNLSSGRSGMTATTITYDKAGVTPLVVGSKKSIVGVGSAGVIIGKGLHLPGTTGGVIVQNVHITVNKTPTRQVFGGGDTLSMDGNDGVWIDHCKFSKMGRMFFVSHYAASRFTVSNTEFDGATTTSATCNGDTYWGAMFHDMLGRSPKLDADGTIALIEGNRFHVVNIPMHDGAESIATIYNVPDVASASACTAIVGRACESNAITSSGGTWPSAKSTTPLNTIAALKKYLVTLIMNAGVGKITV